MVKTQVQIPDHLYYEAKRVANEYEMSFAEVVRRGLERVIKAYPPRAEDSNWIRPAARNLGCRPLTAEQLRDAAREENETPGWLLKHPNRRGRE